jgi:hypothetical protein
MARGTGRVRTLRQRTDDLKTAAGFLSERQDYLHVYAAPSVSGSGWDVVMRIDGTYSGRELAEAAAGGMREWIGRLRDVASDDRGWWDGPPWLRPLVDEQEIPSVTGRG